MDNRIESKSRQIGSVVVEKWAVAKWLKLEVLVFSLKNSLFGRDHSAMDNELADQQKQGRGSWV